MFSQCGACNCAGGGGTGSCFTVVRRIGGFAEYIPSSTTTNPFTWFIGRHYLLADYTLIYNAVSIEGYCSGPQGTSTPGDPVGDNAPSTASFNYTAVSQFDSPTNNPSVGVTGSGNVTGPGTSFVVSEGFDPTGYYRWYNTTDFGLTGGGAQIIGGPQPCFDPPASYTDYVSDSGGTYGCDSITTSGGNNCGGCCLGNAFSTPNFNVTSSGGGGNQTQNGSLTRLQFLGANDSECSCTRSYSPISCDTSWDYSFQDNLEFNSSCSGTLETEIDYDAIHDSVIAAVASIQGASPIDPSTGQNNWGFDDYPIDTGDWTFPGAPFDGHLISKEYVTGQDIPGGGGAILPVTGCVLDGEGLTGASLSDHAYASTWWALGHPDNPGAAVYDTFLAAQSMQVNLTTPYIIVTYIIMNDFSLVLDTYGTGACVDGTATGEQWIPQPSAKSLPAALYSSSGGILSGPIGRMNIIVPGVTCATWDGTTPT